ncbi:MAG: hypothetical protein QM516_06030, partial [Limnohabitans sp.]|nr:hypothetical protein [Limnohabitans sp.]
AEEVVAEEVASVDIRAESVALPSEQELDSDAAWPNAFDTSLDTLSLFHGIESSKWIDTSDVGSTIVSRRIESGDGAFDDGRNDRS